MATYVVPSSGPQVAVKVPAHRFRQGNRAGYTFTLDLAQLDGLLPQRVDEDVIKDANRRLTPAHAKGIQDYLLNRDDWVLGAILLGASQEALKFEGYPEADGKPSRSFGSLSILANRVNTLRLIDGQHRRRAIEDALAALHQQIRDLTKTVADAEKGQQAPEAIAVLRHELTALTDRRRALETASLPVIIYEEDDIAALRRMFADAAKTKPIDKVTQARFNDMDAFNLAADEFTTVSTLFSGRIELERSTVSRSTAKLLSFNQLAEILRTLMYGYYGRVSRVRNDELLADRDPIVELGLEWADDFLPAARQEYDDIIGGDVVDSDIPSLRGQTLAYNATVLRVLAACFHGWKTRVSDDTTPLASFLREQNFKPSLKSSMFVTAGLLAPGGSTPVARRQEVTGAIDYIIRAAQR